MTDDNQPVTRAEFRKALSAADTFLSELNHDPRSLASYRQRIAAIFDGVAAEQKPRPRVD